MMEFYKNLCGDELPVQHGTGDHSWDPMVEEIAMVCGRVIERPISFSPSPQRTDDIIASLEYTPQTMLWDKVAELNAEGPGVHVTPLVLSMH
jgi:hypothetical protein